ncbi:MAG: DUF3996 domain-containing protein [Candidatus Eisenbacteria bacterium]|nr:DUF3996 domain-containing protein [Candidatus Eisenbacteria bacterium]
MKTVSLVFVLFALAFGMVEARGEEGLGVGVIVGEPTGISIKTWISGTRAVDGAAAWSLSENEAFQFHADYLIHNFTLLKLKESEGRLPVYYGVGARIRLNNGDGANDGNASVGVRIPFGIAYMFARHPIDIFLEVVPILDVAPDTDFDINAAIGARYYFR